MVAYWSDTYQLLEPLNCLKRFFEVAIFIRQASHAPSYFKIFEGIDCPLGMYLMRVFANFPLGSRP